MKKMQMKKLLSCTLAAAMVISLSACSGSTADTAEETTEKDQGSENTAAEQNSDETAADDEAVTFDSLTLGDYSDLTADIKVLTGRTDYVDNVFQDYIKEFQKLYPNITISYEGISDYDQTATTRLTNKDWGDLCSIPTTINNSELGEYFVSYGDPDVLAENYNFTSFKAYDGNCYGISMVGNMQGIVYNKKVFADAGITELPKTPDEFIEALRAIKANTDAVPLCTLFGSQWPMVFWDSFIGGTATGNADFLNIDLPRMKDPFSKDAFADGTGPYAVYNILYTAVNEGLVEDDPATSDFESSLAQMNNGKIGVMMIGCGAISSIQGAGPNPDDIAYMPFPITVDGKQYATTNSDYCYGINKNSSSENQLAAMLYVKWLSDESGYYEYVGGVPVNKSKPLPAELFANFTDVVGLEDTAASDEDADLFTNINNGSELSLNSDTSHVMSIVEHAMQKDETLDDIMAEWNEKWTTAQEENGVTAE